MAESRIKSAEENSSSSSSLDIYQSQSSTSYGLIGSSLRADAPAYRAVIGTYEHITGNMQTMYPVVKRSSEPRLMHTDKPQMLPTPRLILPKSFPGGAGDSNNRNESASAGIHPGQDIFNRQASDILRNEGFSVSAELANQYASMMRGHNSESMTFPPTRPVDRDFSRPGLYNDTMRIPHETHRAAHTNEAIRMPHPNHRQSQFAPVHCGRNMPFAEENTARMVGMGMLIPPPLAMMHQQHHGHAIDPYPHDDARAGMMVSPSMHRYPQMQQQVSSPSHAMRKPPSPRERHHMHHEPESADGCVYQVHFKRAHRNFLLSPAAPRNIMPGDFVKVEADRGEDLGVVVSKVPAKDFEEFIPTAGYRGRGFSSGQGEKKFIYRLAFAEEKLLLKEKVRDEERALRVIREKVVQRHLPMAILDAEYQFDRHKLVFFFEADRRIDFRELVSDLFSLYKTRIWMQQVDTSVLPDHEIRMEIARAAGFLPSSYNYREMEMLIEEEMASPSPPRLGHHLTLPQNAIPAMHRADISSSLGRLALHESPLSLPLEPTEDWSLGSPHSPSELARELAEQSIAEQSYLHSLQSDESCGGGYGEQQESPFGFSDTPAGSGFFGSDDLLGGMGALLGNAWAFSAGKDN